MNKIPYIIIIIAIITIISVHILEYLGYAPCDLCLKGRYVWYAIIIASPAILYPKTQNITLTVMTIALITNTAFSIYHAGGEYNLWQLTQSCQASINLSFNDILNAPIPCDKPALTILGISLAGFNALLSLATAILISYKLRHER